MLAEVALPLPLDQTFTYSVPKHLEPQIQAGHSVLVPFRNRSLSGIVTQLRPDEENPSPNLKTLINLLNPLAKVSQIQLSLTRWISETYGCSWGEALSTSSPGLKNLKKPIKLSFVEKPEAPRESKSHALTPEQSAAVESLRGAIQSGSPKTFLLFGVTSSGKTEVYLNAIQETVELQGKTALFLVPEISLCRPFYEILRSRTQREIGIWHSQMTRTERVQTIEGVRSGKIKIVLGARSALFAPLDNVGLIILDEEHDFSYKQEEKPRYHARDAAVRLAELHKAVVVLGSATPSIESFYMARAGKYELLKLTQRVPGQSMPVIQLVDRKKSLMSGKPATRVSPLTPELVEAIRMALSRREQVILALNRRGFSTFLLCTNCGEVSKCPNCLITLVQHKDDDGREMLECHFCFYKVPVPSKCGKCGASAFLLGGFGTQKIVQEVKKDFPYSRVLRLDRDIAKKKNAVTEAYESFKKEEADIWVGTQMVTQGFDFPRVTLVGIVDADTALHHPDFRSAERTFQWISQASGRAGRSSMIGNVVVQTLMPEHYALRASVQGEYEKFFEEELEIRKSLSYPPFSNLILLRLQSSQKKELVITECDRLYDILKADPELNDAQILGPGPAPRENLNKQTRWQILLKCRDEILVKKAVARVQKFQVKSGVRLVLDVNPFNVL